MTLSTKELTTPKLHEEPSSNIEKLALFFGLAYSAGSVGQSGGLISFPVSYFLKETIGLDAAQATQYLAILALPWAIKPVFGLVSDLVPFYGFRRKSYLILMSAMSIVGFLWLAGLTDPPAIVSALFLVSMASAFSDVLVDALMVEVGQATGQIEKLQGQQWLWAKIAAIVVSVLGGWLCHVLAPAKALHAAALIALLAPTTVMLASVLLVKERKLTASAELYRDTLSGLKVAAKSKKLWLVLAFLAFWYISPGFETPLYYYKIDRLKFDQAFIGQLGAIASCGAILGAWSYKRFFARLPQRLLIHASVIMGTLNTLAYLLLVDRTSAIVLAFVTSAVSMIATLTMFSLAAHACPKRAEGFTFAMMMAAINLCVQASAIFGAQLYSTVLHNEIAPLIWISAGFTALCFFVVPFLPREA